MSFHLTVALLFWAAIAALIGLVVATVRVTVNDNARNEAAFPRALWSGQPRMHGPGVRVIQPPVQPSESSSEQPVTGGNPEPSVSTWGHSVANLNGEATHAA